MNLRHEFEKRIEKKKQELADLERATAEAKAYLQALTDTLRLIPKNDEESTTILRPGTDLARAQEILRKVGRPLHIAAILTEMGKPVTKESKVSLSTSISGYVRRRVIFSRPLPNTFGLLEHPSESIPEDDIPEGFGKLVAQN